MALATIIAITLGAVFVWNGFFPSTNDPPYKPSRHQYSD